VLKNLTITVEEEVLQWAKHAAVEAGVPVSKLVGELLAKEMRRKDSYWKAFEDWKKIEPIPGLDASQRGTRDEIHERKR
jgi:hypothetical protein